MSFCQNGGRIHTKRSDSNEPLLPILTLDFLGSCSIITLRKSTGKYMFTQTLSKLLNWIIGLTVGAVLLAAFVNYLAPTDPNTGFLSTTIVNYSTCKNKVERPRQQTVWGEVSTGYDCMD